MLSCRDVSNLASDYLNRDLPLRRRLAVRLHLLMCDGCTRYVRQMRSAVALLRQMGSASAASDQPSPGAAAESDDQARTIFRSTRRS